MTCNEIPWTNMAAIIAVCAMGAVALWSLCKYGLN